MNSGARTIVITGASSGIGRALALGAAREGFRCVLVARRADRLEQVAQAIRSAGGACVTLVADVRKPDTAARVIDIAIRSYERIDVVVNNAGGGAFGPLLEQTDAEIESQWQLHVAGPLRIARMALPYLEKTHGQLVFLGSGIARVPLPFYGAYAPAKAAIRAAAIQLRRELRSRGVAVTYVDPGLVATEFHSAMGIERAKEVAAASPESVARAILRGITRRSAVVNATGWQTVGTVVGEWFGTLADPTIVSRLSAQKVAPRDSAEGGEGSPPPTESALAATSEFEKALEPVARRMERVKLSPTFVREALVPGATLELNELAMRWAGMPNKNERAAMHEVLDALAAAGYLEPMEDETWKVKRAAD
jgi:short-subunit dehydrogenase